MCLQSKFDIAEKPTQKIKHSICHLKHSEEMATVLESRNNMYSIPEQFVKETDKKHVDFQTETTTITSFNQRVFDNLISHGYKNTDLHSKPAAERLKLLRNTLCTKQRR